MLGGVAGDFPQIFGHAHRQKVGADEVRRTVGGTLFVAAADIAVLPSLVCFIPLLVHDTPTVGAEQQAGEQANLAVAVGPLTLFAKLLHSLPGGLINDGLVSMLKNHHFFFWIEYAGLDLVGHLLRLEVDGMPQVLPPFQNVRHGVARPFAGVVRVVAAGAAGAPVLHRPRRGDVLLGQHPGNLGGAVPGKAQTEYLLYNRCGLRVNDKLAVLAFQIAIDRLAGDGFSAHAFSPENRFDFLARVPHHPFVK